MFSLVAAPMVEAATYYVSPTGDDSNSGIYKRPLGRNGLEHAVEFSNELVGWQSDDRLLKKTVQDNGDGTETVTVKTSATDAIKFMRLSIKRRDALANLPVILSQPA